MKARVCLFLNLDNIWFKKKELNMFKKKQQKNNAKLLKELWRRFRIVCHWQETARCSKAQRWEDNDMCYIGCLLKSSGDLNNDDVIWVLLCPLSPCWQKSILTSKLFKRGRIAMTIEFHFIILGDYSCYMGHRLDIQYSAVPCRWHWEEEQHQSLFVPLSGSLDGKGS